MQTARLPWWDEDDTPEQFEAGIQHATTVLNGNQIMPLYIRRSFFSCILMANRLEQTLPEGVADSATYQLLEAELDIPLQVDVQPVLTWPAEGGGTTEQTRQQLMQFLKAGKYLCQVNASQPLSMDIICTTHNLLMSGAIEKDGTPVAAGRYRTTPAYSGTGYVYPEANTIPGRLLKIVTDFNVKVDAAATSSYKLAAELLYDTVTLHPFQNGNGRLCRLLAAYAAIRRGEPFTLHLSNGHSRARKHYQQVLRHAEKTRTTTRLEYFILECLHLQWQNALSYAGL